MKKNKRGVALVLRSRRQQCRLYDKVCLYLRIRIEFPGLAHGDRGNRGAQSGGRDFGGGCDLGRIRGGTAESGGSRLSAETPLIGLYILGIIIGIRPKQIAIRYGGLFLKGFII